MQSVHVELVFIVDKEKLCILEYGMHCVQVVWYERKVVPEPENITFKDSFNIPSSPLNVSFTGF